MKSALVLGGGMVGVSALHLQRRGWSVKLVDRKAPGQETSYGNAGIIQSEAVRPYPMPRDLASLAKIAAGLTNDVRYRLTSLPQHVEPLLRYCPIARIASRHPPRDLRRAAPARPTLAPRIAPIKLDS
jgi:D-amino-acid dehydrogenase